ncbi:SMI1/KNR4 family protein [Amycolatopsis sp. FDAARGOS 1241]|uniref:SMI1/KNR4 family protein n=1 Tax=Amycolatopsis sp. FDAARGOS 1241 TaxID=2778070 RepID=UPI00195056BD|nr:SMI1/KNR4 family protein [Amycolatopsis sp. FDAARGOS 1241]QRP50102.1 SMI1/KNR4 family protein [Amycolatopsis sp. FDAARGOS 1241]
MDWKPWLRRWSEEWISTAEEDDELDEAVLRDRWLGFGSATEDEVARAEARLGFRLPPSYRDFLLTTNGWRRAGMFVFRMRDTETVDWLRHHEPYWEEWEELCEDDNPDPDPGNSNRFSRGLLLSLEADAGILFLDPLDVDEKPEWAAYSLFSWRAEPPVKFASFAELMEDLYAEFHRMRRPAGPTRDHWDAAVERARLDALAGNTGAAEETLKRAEDFGRERATVLRAQLLILAGREYKARSLLRRLLHESFSARRFPDRPGVHRGVRALPVRRPPAYRGTPPLVGVAGGDDRRTAWDHEDGRRTRAAVLGEGLSYGNAEFDERIRRARTEHEHDPEALWAAIRAALPHWRPRTPDHLAPVVLLADPVLAAAVTRERGRELLATARAGLAGATDPD